MSHSRALWSPFLACKTAQSQICAIVHAANGLQCFQIRTFPGNRWPARSARIPDRKPARSIVSSVAVHGHLPFSNELDGPSPHNLPDVDTFPNLPRK